MNPASDAVAVRFFYKVDCHLCERMQRELAALLERTGLRRRMEVEMCDIDSDPAWHEKYREYVPVLVVNGEEVCHYFLDELEFLKAIDDEQREH